MARDGVERGRRLLCENDPLSEDEARADLCLDLVADRLPDLFLQRDEFLGLAGAVAERV